MMSPSDGGDMLMNVFGQVSPAPQVEMCGVHSIRMIIQSLLCF